MLVGDKVRNNYETLKMIIQLLERKGIANPEYAELLVKQLNYDPTEINQEEKTMFKVGSEYKTRDGRMVRIYETDAGGNYPIHGAVLSADTSIGWIQVSWNVEGKVDIYSTSGKDLIKQPRVRFAEELDCGTLLNLLFDTEQEVVDQNNVGSKVIELIEVIK